MKLPIKNWKLKAYLQIVKMITTVQWKRNMFLDKIFSIGFNSPTPDTTEPLVHTYIYLNDENERCIFSKFNCEIKIHN